MSASASVRRSRTAIFRAGLGSIIVLMMMSLNACKDSKNDDDPGDGNGDKTGESCEHHVDCGVEELCREGVCESAGTCSQPSQWETCTRRAEKALEGEGWMYACMDQQCTRACIHDTDCAGEDEICSDFGRCISYDGELLEYDSGDNTPGELRAGVAQKLLDMPIGVEMGGYGNRASKNEGRYAVSLSASQGQTDAQYVRAVAMENGNSRLLLMRLPIVFSFSQLHERVAQELQKETGIDWRDEFIMSSTHTHSGPTGFWRFPEETAIDPGMLGAGKFNQILEDWFVESMVTTALEAIDNMQDAKFGWTIVENYDPYDEVAKDRWSSTPPFDMRRLLVMRIDDAQTDTPMAALVSYASHGTSNSKDYMTDDVIGGAEHGISQALYEEYGQSIPTLYFSEAGGTMKPAVGSFPYSRDIAAHRVSSRVVPAFLDIETSREIGMRSRAYRFNVSHERIGYEPTEFRSTLPGTLGGILYSGALLCSGPDADDDDYTTYIDPAKLTCVGNVRTIVHNLQPTPLTRSQITALEIDGLHAITLPGEPAQELAWQVLREMRDRFELPTANNWIFGYANDHLLYMTPTNLRGDAPDVEGFVLGDGMDNPSSFASLDDYPEYAFSYLQGGYETEMTPWGPKSGDFLVERAVDAMTWLLDGEAPSEPHAPILPTQYTHVETPEFTQDPTDDDAIGTIVEEVPERLQRLETLTFGWVGGDHGAEAPQSPLVTLEVEDDDGDWAPAIGGDGLPITNRGLDMATRLKIVDEDSSQPTYEWSVYWQPLRNLPEGTYRLHVEGTYLSASSDAHESYEVLSDAFVVEANDQGSVDLSYDADAHQYELTAYYPALVSLEQNTDGERARLSGALRPVDPRVSVDQPAPIPTQDGAVTATGYTDEDQVLLSGTWDDDASFSFTCATAPFDCTIEGGNGDELVPATIRLTLEADQNIDSLQVIVADQDGNAASVDWIAD